MLQQWNKRPRVEISDSSTAKIEVENDDDLVSIDDEADEIARVQFLQKKLNNTLHIFLLTYPLSTAK